MKKSNPTERATEIQNEIREVLFQGWDPIGLSDNPKLNDEYDSYIGSVYRILASSRSAEKLIDYLFEAENETIGMMTENSEHLIPIAQKLLRIDVNL